MPITPYIVAGKSQIGSTPIPLSKLMAHEDYDCLRLELKVVDQHFTSETAQHPARRWEYALALRALHQWLHDTEPPAISWCDVGGAGSPFHHMPSEVVDSTTRTRISKLSCIIDPRLPVNGRTLHEETGHWDVVFCISVLEHIDDLYEFLADLDRITLPGGMLFLTVDCQEEDGPDNKHFHWMRKRIFSRKTWMELGHFYLERGWEFLGWVDDRWRGEQVFNYTFGSLALKKGAPWPLTPPSNPPSTPSASAVSAAVSWSSASP